MKASERKKNKFKAIKELHKMIKLDKDKIRLFYPKRHENDTLARYVFLETVEKLHRDLFALRAMEKQIKMPVRITVTSCKVSKFRFSNLYTECECVIFKKQYCPRCEKELRIFDANDDCALLERTMQPKYCPYCGQKLWWKR